MRERRQKREVVEQLLVFLVLLEQRGDGVQRFLLKDLEVGERLDGGADDGGGYFPLLIEVGGHREGVVVSVDERRVGRGVLVASGRLQRVARDDVGRAAQRAVGREEHLCVARALQQQLGERAPALPALRHVQRAAAAAGGAGAGAL